MKILLLSPPYLPEYMRNARCDFVSLSKTQWYPIWLGYCGAFLEKNGYEVKLIDAPAYGLNHTQTEDIILNYKPDWLVVYSSTKSEDNDINFTEKLMDLLNIPSVFVGPYVSINPVRILEKSNKIQFAIKGEFEYPVLELLEKKPISQIKNLAYKQDLQIIQNELRPLLSRKELDKIPFLTAFFKKHLDFKFYKTPSEYYPFIDLMTGRGCIWGLCTFCLWVHSFITGKTYNTRSIENVLEEFNFVVQELPEVRSIMIQDDTLSEERATELSEGLLKSNIKISWSCYARANMNYETLKLMKKAGCRNLHVGYESISDNVLKNIKKGITVEKMERFTADAKKAGLRIHADFMLGLPGETKESTLKLINWAKKINPHTAQFQLINPYEITPLYQYLKDNNYFNKNGEPNYPDLSTEEIRKLGKLAYRKFYLSFNHLKKVISSPYEHFFGRLDTISRAIPAIFWKKW